MNSSTAMRHGKEEVAQFHFFYVTISPPELDCGKCRGSREKGAVKAKKILNHASKEGMFRASLLGRERKRNRKSYLLDPDVFNLLFSSMCISFESPFASPLSSPFFLFAIFFYISPLLQSLSSPLPSLPTYASVLIEECNQNSKAYK